MQVLYISFASCLCLFDVSKAVEVLFTIPKLVSVGVLLPTEGVLKMLLTNSARLVVPAFGVVHAYTQGPSSFRCKAYAVSCLHDWTSNMLTQTSCCRCHHARPIQRELDPT